MNDVMESRNVVAGRVSSFAGARTATVVILCLLVLAGCKAQPDQSRAGKKNIKATTAGPTAAITNTDPCATRLHEISGLLLLYYGTNHRLPPALKDLAALQPGEPLELTCPVSHQPYIYDPTGLSIPVQGGHAVVFDPAPSHDGIRWAITIIEPGGQGALVAKVIAIPEKSFSP